MVTKSVCITNAILHTLVIRVYCEIVFIHTKAPVAFRLLAYGLANLPNVYTVKNVFRF